MPYVSGLVNGIQARENHKSVNGMQLNGIRVWQMHNVNALHRRLHTAGSVLYSSVNTHNTEAEPFTRLHGCLRGLQSRYTRPLVETNVAAREGYPSTRKWHTDTVKP